MRKELWRPALLVACLALGLVATARADEGMWLVSALPESLKENHDFEPSAEWLDHVRLASVRMGDGGSGAFVSPRGLLMTSHRVGWAQIEKLGSAGRDLIETGFYAPTADEELRCPDLDVYVLVSTQDVTRAVTGGLQRSLTPSQKYYVTRAHAGVEAKRAALRTELHCEVLPLYYAARYHLYQYKRYTDVRLVMAPERAVAHYGGEAARFEYPRVALDVCFFRVYEDGKPLETEHWLRRSQAGATEDEFVIVAGHPGPTARLHTVSHVKHLRDVKLPALLDYARRREVQLQAFSARSAEHARVARGELAQWARDRKSLAGQLAVLQDPAGIHSRMAWESALQEGVKADEAYQARWGDAWDLVASAHRAERRALPRFLFLEGPTAGGGSRLFGIARHLVRLPDQLKVISMRRLPEYRDTNLEPLYTRLFSHAPIDEELEVDRLASAFSHLAEEIGADKPFVSKVCNGKPPHDHAAELVAGTNLDDVEARRQVADGGRPAIMASTDLLIRFMHDLEIQGLEARGQYDSDVVAAEQEGYLKIAGAHYTLSGQEAYPNGSGSLRLAFGSVHGYAEKEGRVPPFTTLGGLYDRHTRHQGWGAFALPPRWLEHKAELDLSTPLNFVCTADIAEGNAGSPVVNREGELVGLVIDGNAHTHAWMFRYDDERGRAIAVDARAIPDVLRVIYDAAPLVDELAGP